MSENRDAATSEGGNRDWVFLALSVCVLLVGAALRLLYLDADPKHYAWVGYLTDEGRWTHQAREISLFGQLDLSGWLATVHLLVAPLYQATIWVSYALFGVGFTSARLVSGVTGVLLLVAMLLFSRRRMSPEALLLVMLAIALQRDVIFLSRVAIPEMPLMLFEFLAFALLVSEPRSIKRALLAGVVLSVGLGFKGTGIPMFPIMAGVTAVVHRKDDPSSALRRVAAFCGAVLGAAALALAAALLVAELPSSSQLSNLGGLLGTSSLYPAASFLLYQSFAPGINYFVMGIWVTVGILIAFGPPPDSRARATFLGSLTWIVAWMTISLFWGYFPERYVFHVFIPIALCLGASLTILQTIGAGEIRRALREVLGFRRLVAAAWLALPLAVFLCPLLMSLTDAAGLTLDRLPEQLILIVLLDCTLALVAYRLRGHEGLLFGLILPALVAAPLRVAAVQSSLMADDFWIVSGASVGPWLALVTLAAVAAWAGWRARTAGWAAGLATDGYLAVTAVLLLVIAIPQISDRTYTVRDAAQHLVDTFEPDDTVWTHRSAGIVFGTRLRYREALSTDDPPLIVSMHGASPPPGLPGAYDVLEQREIEVGVDQEYLDNHGIDRFLRILTRVP